MSGQIKTETRNVPYIVIWMTRVGCDGWRTFDTMPEAEAFYIDITEQDNVFTASIVRPVESTDYDTLPIAELAESTKTLLDSDYYTDAPECQREIALTRNAVREALSVVTGEEVTPEPVPDDEDEDMDPADVEPEDSITGD